MNVNVVVVSNLLPRTKLLQNWTDLVYTLNAGVDKFIRKILESPQNSVRQKGNIERVSFRGPTNIRCPSRLQNLVPGRTGPVIYAPPSKSLIVRDSRIRMSLKTLCYISWDFSYWYLYVSFWRREEHFVFFYKFLYEMIKFVSGDRADKSEATFLELVCFDPIKTVILSPESTTKIILQ